MPLYGIDGSIVDNVRYVDGADRCVAMVGSLVNDCSDSDARLIAAAPDMLHQLAGLVAQADAQRRAGDKCLTVSFNVVDTLRDILAKSTGQE